MSFLSLALLLLAVPGFAWASCHPNCPVAPPGGLAFQTPGAFLVASPFRATDKYVLGAGLGYAFPTEPMAAKQFYVKLVPGIWTSSADRDAYLAPADFRGYLLAGSLLYGIDQHWGINFTGVWEQSNDGSAETITVYQQKKPRAVTLSGHADGYIVALGVVYDPIAGPRFRLPMVVGIGHNYYSATIEDSFGVTTAGGTTMYRYYGNHNVSRFSAYLGIAPQVDYRAFRFIPFVVTSDSAFFGGHGTSIVRLQNLATGASREAQLSYSEVTYLSGGLTVKYLPWNLGLSYIRGDLLSRGIDTNVLSLTWDKKW